MSMILMEEIRDRNRPEYRSTRGTKPDTYVGMEHIKSATAAMLLKGSTSQITTTSLPKHKPTKRSLYPDRIETGICTDTLISYLPWQFVLAGGSIARILRDVKPNDYDFFIIEDGVSTTVNRIQMFGNAVVRAFPGYGFLVHNTGSVVSYYCHKDGTIIKLQLILKPFANISELLHDFDMHPAAVAYYHGLLHMTEAAVFAHAFGLNLVDPRYASGSFIHRIAKYQEELGFVTVLFGAFNEGDIFGRRSDEDRWCAQVKDGALVPLTPDRRSYGYSVREPDFSNVQPDGVRFTEICVNFIQEVHKHNATLLDQELVVQEYANRNPLYVPRTVSEALNLMDQGKYFLVEAAPIEHGPPEPHLWTRYNPDVDKFWYILRSDVCGKAEKEATHAKAQSYIEDLKEIQQLLREQSALLATLLASKQ